MRGRQTIVNSPGAEGRQTEERARRRVGKNHGERAADRKRGRQGSSESMLLCAWGEEVGYGEILASSTFGIPSFQRLVFCSLSSIFLS